MDNNVQIRHSGYLMITAMIWGAAFVAQSVGMDYVGPFTFLFARSVVGALALIPVTFLFGGKDSPSINADSENPVRRWLNGFRESKLLQGGLVCGFFLFTASILQQIGIQYTSAGKAGFITTFYIIIVPLAGIFFGKKTGVRIWIAVILALIGLYFLCLTESFSIGRGDIFVLLCAFLFAGQILAVDYYNPFVDSVRLSLLEFLVEAVLAGILMMILEKPTWAGMVRGAGPILYTGVFSTGIGYTLQAVGQRGLNPAIASLIMSLESVFSVIFGFLILHEQLTGRELLGCIIMFAAILIAQIKPGKVKRNRDGVLNS